MAFHSFALSTVDVDFAKHQLDLLLDQVYLHPTGRIPAYEWKDRSGDNKYEGGFLWLDNIAVFDRSAPLPTGGYLEQADGTAWVTLFCQNMLEIACELAAEDSTYQRTSRFSFC